jgi:hypothetical protein
MNNMRIQTRESVRKAKSCYSDEKIAKLVPPEGNTPKQVAELPISDADRLWGLIYSCGATQKDLVEFACKCARRVRQSAAGLRAIETAEAWLRGEATAEDCRKAADAASAFADADADAARAAYADAYTYAFAADAAAYAARAAYDDAYTYVYAGCNAAFAAAFDDASDVAFTAAYAAERKWQIQTLVEILERN